MDALEQIVELFWALISSLKNEGNNSIHLHYRIVVGMSLDNDLRWGEASFSCTYAHSKGAVNDAVAIVICGKS